MEIAYHVIVLIVSGFALMRGWKLGLVQQIGGVLGVAFGCVTAHIFLEPAAAFFMQLHLWPIDNVAADFATQLLGASTIYSLTYFAMWCFGRLLVQAMALMQTGVLNRIFGTIFCMAKYALTLSIFFNFAIASNPSSMLMKYACDDDGNLVEGVMLMAPTCIGCQSYWDLNHKIQLKEAKKISLNHIAPSLNHFAPSDVVTSDKSI